MRKTKKTVATKPKRKYIRRKKVEVVGATPQEVEQIVQTEEDPFAKFRMPIPDPVHGDADKKYCKREKFVPGKMKNVFKDDRKSEMDSANFDKLVRNAKNKNPVPRREPVQISNWRCSDCNKKFAVLPHELKIDEEGETYYRCDECIVDKMRGLR